MSKHGVEDTRSLIDSEAAGEPTAGADGRYCRHHDDDPAHTKDCYEPDRDIREELNYLKSDKAIAARAALHAQNLAVHTQDAATAMRDACVEKVRAIGAKVQSGEDYTEFHALIVEIIEGLQVVTINQVKQ